MCVYRKSVGLWKEQVAMGNDACMVVLLTAKCVQVCVSVCIYVQIEQGIVARSTTQSVFWVILVLRHCRYDFLGMERDIRNSIFQPNLGVGNI